MKKMTLIVGGLVIITVLYIASIGPAWALTEHGYISEPIFQALYSPLGGLENHCPGDLLWRYESWCAPMSDIHM